MSSLNILPTLMSLAGGELPPDRKFDGVDLMPFLRGQERGDPHGALYWRNGTNRAIRSGDWKLFWNQHQEWLFDLTDDMGAAENLADKHPAKAEELKERYRGWEGELAEPLWPARPARQPVEVDGILINISI